MKLFLRLTTLVFPALISACSTTPHQSELDTLKSAQQETQRLLAYQAEELQVQRQELVLLQTRNSELTEVLFDLRQELNAVKQGARPSTSSVSASSRNKTRSVRAGASRSLPLVDESGRAILGTAEWVWFDVLGRSVQARVDDKSKSSSIRAYDIQLFERDGDEWVRFSLAAATNGDKDKPAIYEAPVLRKMRVRPAGGDEAESRPVVRLKIKLGDLIDNTEFTLVSRDVATFPVVLGRSFLRDIAVVDEKRQYIQPTLSENSSL